MMLVKRSQMPAPLEGDCTQRTLCAVRVQHALHQLCQGVGPVLCRTPFQLLNQRVFQPLWVIAWQAQSVSLQTSKADQLRHGNEQHLLALCCATTASIYKSSTNAAMLQLAAEQFLLSEHWQQQRKRMSLARCNDNLSVC